MSFIPISYVFVLFGTVLNSGDVESNYQSAKWKVGGGGLIDVVLLNLNWRQIITSEGLISLCNKQAVSVFIYDIWQPIS